MTNTPFKWTEELRATAIEEYKDRMSEIPEDERANVTQEIAEEIAKELGCAVNSLRTILQRAKNQDGTSVYVSKAAKPKSSAAKADGAKRRSKADSHADLIAAIKRLVGDEAVDEEVIGKLTGKAADYFTSVFVELEQ